MNKPISFVEKVIKTAEGLSNGKVIALVCFPVDFRPGWKREFGVKARITPQAEAALKANYQKMMGKTVYMLDSKSDIEDLANACINFFS